MYIGSVAMTVFWSVYLHVSWAARARLPEDAPARFLLIVLPSTYLLLVVLAGWEGIPWFRLDLAGLLVLDGVTLVLWIASALLFALARRVPRGFRAILVTYNLVAVLAVSGVWVLRLWPTLLERARSLLEQGRSLDILSFSWLRGGSRAQAGSEQDLAAMLNRILIAALGYIPIAVVRMAYGSGKRRKMAQEISVLRRRMDVLESTLERRSASEPQPEGTREPEGGA